jgi:hypothetical protein
MQPVSTRFVKKSNDEFTYKPKKIISRFYQICSFKDPKTNKYNVRCVYFNELNEVLGIKEQGCSGKRCNKIINSSSDSEYKMYHTYDLDYVELPDIDDLMKSQSPLLN